jgi:hypothetical protein
MAKTSKPDLSIPKQVQANAKKGLELRQEHGFGGTKVGEATATLLIKGGPLTARKIRHIASYFPRHAHDNLGQTEKNGKPSRGYIAWLLWGGDEGRKWSEGLVKQLDQSAASAQS